MYYQNYNPVAAVVYGLEPIREPDKAKLTPMRVGRIHCMAQSDRHFEVALRGQRLTDIRRKKIQEWEVRVHNHGAIVDDVAILEKRLKTLSS